MTPQKRKANNALGAFGICSLFLLETVVADQVRPNPLSVVVWSVLGLGATASLAAHFWFRSRNASG
jgi:hypothetical protein